MSHQPYPAFDIDCAKDIVRIVRNGAIAAEAPLFAKCVYTLAGAGLAMSVGEPSDVQGVFGDAEVTTDDLEECLNALQKAEDSSEENFGAGDEAEAIDPATIAMLIQLAITLITKWLERRRA